MGTSRMRLLREGGDKFTSPRPLRSRSEKEFTAGGNVFDFVKKASQSQTERKELTFNSLLSSVTTETLASK